MSNIDNTQYIKNILNILSQKHDLFVTLNGDFKENPCKTIIYNINGIIFVSSFINNEPVGSLRQFIDCPLLHKENIINILLNSIY